MIRFIMGLSLACLIAGCGEPAAEPETKTDEKDASVTTPAADESVATSDHSHAEGESHAAETDETPAAEAAATLMTVKFKVPGMT
jgi:hypothetical protein